MSNGKKAFLWFVLCVILFALGQYGKSLYYSGHGTIGKIRYNLFPITEEFMKVDTIIRNGITATYEDDKIVVKTPNKEYIYKYVKENNYEYLVSSFGIDDGLGQTVARGMIDAVYRYHGGKNTLFIKYNLFNFLGVNAEDGVSLSAEDSYEIKININSDIISCLPEV